MLELWYFSEISFYIIAIETCVYIEIHVHLTVQRVYVRVLCTDQTALGYLPTGDVIRN